MVIHCKIPDQIPLILWGDMYDLSQICITLAMIVLAIWGVVLMGHLTLLTSKITLPISNTFCLRTVQFKVNNKHVGPSALPPTQSGLGSGF